MKVFLSPSNQDANVWAIGNTNEKVQAEAFADKLEAKLKAAGVEVARADHITPFERINHAKGCDLIVPLHTNGFNGTVRGCRLFVYRDKAAKTLAEKNDKAMKALGAEIEKLGITPNVRYYYDYESWDELNDAAKAGIPAVYSESIFHDNVEDCEWYFANVDKLVDAYTKGICDFLNIAPAPESKVLYRVQTGAFKNKAGAESFRDELIGKGFEAFVTQVGELYKVQVGAFANRLYATLMQTKLKSLGYDSFIVSNGTVKVGSVVRIAPGAKTYDGGSLAPFVFIRDHVVKEIAGDRAVVAYNGIIVAAMKVSDLIYVRG